MLYSKHAIPILYDVVSSINKSILTHPNSTPTMLCGFYLGHDPGGLGTAEHPHPLAPWVHAVVAPHSDRGWSGAHKREDHDTESG